MCNLDNWTTVAIGLYEYPITYDYWIEIHVMYHEESTDILTAKASLYLVSCRIIDEDDPKFFSRELLLNGPLMACLEKAVEYEKEIMRK